MGSIQSQYSLLYTNHYSGNRPAEISGSGTNDTQKTFASILESHTSQNIAPSTKTQTGTPIDLDEYYSDIPSYQANLLASAPLLMPNAETIQSIADHASARLQAIMADYNIPEAPEKITYNSSGEMVLPGNYPYKNEFTAALADNPGLERELHDLNAISSHYAGIKQAMENGSSFGYQDIALLIGQDGGISIQADGETIFESSASGVTDVSEPVSVVINGRKVIVSGHDLDNMEGRSLFITVEGINIQRLREFAEQEMNSGEHIYENNILMIDGKPAMKVSTTPLPEGAQYGYTNVEYFNADGQTGLGAIRPGNEDAYYRRLVTEYMEVLDIERKLKETYGNDIKLVYSHIDNCHIMLTPDDARYDEMKSVEQGLHTLLGEINKGHINRSGVADLLTARRYSA